MKKGVGPVTRSIFSKVMWVGRATLWPVVIAIMLVVVFGAPPASAHTGYKGLFHLGHKNVSGAVSTLVGKVATGSALVVKNPSGGSALGLQVNEGQAPMTVNAEAGKATNLSADELDGKDSSAFLGKTEKAADASRADDADKLDGKDSGAFAIRTDHSIASAADCDTPNTWNLCAPVTVTVPAGKTYYVSVWSSFTAKGGANPQDVAFCSARQGLANPCITPWGIHSRVTIEAGQLGAAASSGETIPLSEGEYTFGTAISPPSEQFAAHGDARVITKVMVRDTANSF